MTVPLACLWCPPQVPLLDSRGGRRTHLRQALPALPLAMMGEKTANKIEKSYWVKSWVRRDELVLRTAFP